MSECTDLTKQGCTNCPFRGKKVGSRGRADAEFVIVGESPGSTELKSGMPFSGPSGKILESNLPPDMDAYITNALSCMPVGKNEKILANAVFCCSGRLKEEIAAHPRKMILALGNGALWSLTGDYSLRITKERGKRFESPLAEHGIVATLHPAFLLRGGGSYKKFQEDIQYALSIMRGEETKGYIEPETVVMQEPGQLSWLKEQLAQQIEVASDIETSHLNYRKGRILSVGFCWEPSKCYIVPGEFAVQFKEEMENKKIHWIWHNGKFDIGWLRHNGIEARVDEDTMLLNYALDETRGIHDLDQVASDVLAAPNHKQDLDKYFEGVKKENRSYADIPQDVLYDYHGKDLSKTLQIYQVLRKRVAMDPALNKLYTKTLIPASELLYHVERNGFMFDWDQWEKNRAFYEGEDGKSGLVGELLKEIQEIAGYAINPNSSQQMCKLLYDELRLPCKKRSTDKKAVAKLPDHPVVLALRKYRVATKALSTYIHGMAASIQDDGRAHPTFLLHGTRTGRLACRGPNLQNIPRDPKLRGMFKAAPGYILVDLDASQAELRSLAIMSGDERMIEIFNSTDRSLHKETAIFRYGPNYTEDEYVRAKAVNFGIVYGRTAFSLAEEFGIPTAQAEKEIKQWFAMFPDAEKFINRCRQAPLKNQVLTTNFGRKCRPGMVSPENMNEVQNEFANFPHQATASDITLHVAMRIRPELDKLGARIVDLVHDSIVVEVPNEPAKIEIVKKLGYKTFPEVAVDWGLTRVPFKADAKLCINWGTTIKENAS